MEKKERVYRYKRREPVNKIMSDEEMDFALDLYENGFSVKYISLQLEQKYQVVYERLKHYYGVTSLKSHSSDKKYHFTKEELDDRKDLRDDYWCALANEILDDDGYYAPLKRVNEIYPPIGDELSEKIVNEIVEKWNNKSKGEWDRRKNRTVYPNKTGIRKLAEEHNITVEQVKRVIINDHRIVK